MPDVFTALANPTRRSILTELRHRPQSVNELAAHFAIGRPSVSEHLQVLAAVGLVRDERAGQQRIYHLEAGPLADAADWLEPFEQYWKGRLRDLRAVLDEEHR
ncbi:metalloregulator ArsR/SmtB family transcription factor [Agromyces sp. MMS24-JH15]|uniref:metalloregulator ArsR/SmtB family transcription factor n=1 Tax=Agromyces sp. MMS24-JH15 TaxID=3243765 RepID=UPI003749E74C